MRVIKNYLYNAFYQIFILIVPLITTPYLARVLGPKGVGINSYTSSIAQYFILFGSIGVGLYGNRQIAFVRDSKKRMTQVFYEIFFMRLLTIIIACLTFLIFISFVDKYRVFYLAQFLSIVAAAFDISWLFMGVENFGVMVLRNLIVRIVTLVSIFVFVRSYNDLAVYILILSLSSLLGNLVLFPSLHRYISKPNWKNLNIFKHFWPSLVLFIPQIATQVYLVLNKTMLGSIISVQSSGYFDQSDKIVKMILAVVTATGTVMLPHVANAFANGNKEKTKEYLYSSFSFVSVVSVPMMFGLIVLSAKFVRLFLTVKFSEVVPIMMIESIVILLIAWSNAIGTQYLLPTKQTRSFTLSVVLGAIVNLIANIPLILMYGAIGASVATVLSEFSVTLYQLISVRNQIEYKRLFEDIYKYLVSGIIMFFALFYFDKAMSTSWVSLIIETIIGGLIYLTGLFLLRVKIFSKIKLILKL